MRRRVAAFFLITLLAVPVLFSQTKKNGSENLQDHIRESAEIISTSILDRYPDMSLKKGMVILEFEEKSPEARRKKLGNLVQVYLEEALTNSLVVYLIDRNNMEAMMKEQELILSGLLDEKNAPKIGSMKSAQLLLHGSITEEGSDFRVSIGVSEIESAELLMSHSFAVPNEEMTSASLELQYEYVAKNGIGLSASPLYFISADTFFNNFNPVLMDVKVKYRLNRSLMLTAGLMVNPGAGNFRLDDNENSETWTTLQPDLTGADYGGAADNVGQITNDLTDTLIFHLDLQYTLNFSPEFNIGLNLGILGCPYMVSEYKISSTNGLLVKMYDYSTAPPHDYTVTMDRVPIRLEYDGFYGAKFELCPEFFFTPRIALSGVAGYMITSKARVRIAKGEYADWGFYDSAVESNYSDFADDIYFGFDPSLDPNGDPWEISFTGFYGGLTVSLFF